MMMEAHTPMASTFLSRRDFAVRLTALSSSLSFAGMAFGASDAGNAEGQPERQDRG
jgi:hypothetical protein